MRFTGTPVIHRDAKESGICKSFNVRRYFFNVPAERFFAGINAGNDLKLRSLRRNQRLARTDGDGIQRVAHQFPLKRKMKYPPSLEGGKFFDSVDKFLPL